MPTDVAEPAASCRLCVPVRDPPDKLADVTTEVVKRETIIEQADAVFARLREIGVPIRADNAAAAA